MITLNVKGATYSGDDNEAVARAIELADPSNSREPLLLRVWGNELEDDDPIGCDHWEYWDGSIDLSRNAPEITDQLLTEYAAWAHHTRPEEVTITHD